MEAERDEGSGVREKKRATSATRNKPNQTKPDQPKHAHLSHIQRQSWLKRKTMSATKSSSGYTPTAQQSRR